MFIITVKNIKQLYYLPQAHVGPYHPSMHVQLNPPSVLAHVPLFRHGPARHSSTSVWKIYNRIYTIGKHVVRDLMFDWQPCLLVGPRQPYRLIIMSCKIKVTL